jgi:hypothetical protein
MLFISLHLFRDLALSHYCYYYYYYYYHHYYTNS